MFFFSKNEATSPLVRKDYYIECLQGDLNVLMKYNWILDTMGGCSGINYLSRKLQ